MLLLCLRCYCTYVDTLIVIVKLLCYSYHDIPLFIKTVYVFIIDKCNGYNDVWVSTHDVINLMSYTMKGNVVDNMHQLMI